MADLPPFSLRLFKPAFSMGVDCFGPMTDKIGRRTEKRWGVIFKCMPTCAIHLNLLESLDTDAFLMAFRRFTSLRDKIGRRTEKRWGVIFKCMPTCAIHLNLLESLDTDAFLMAFRRFTSLRGKPYEILSDCGTNFKGAEAELRTAFSSMAPDLSQQLSKQKVRFQFNSPNAPHFGGSWEREVKSVKAGLRAALGDQSVTEPVLRTVLAEVEGILNSKPLGYVSSDAADVNPITPNMLLMGRLDPNLPQVIYTSKESMG
ncbi:uncharacterized protein LOC110990980 [Acanthaster planci]|uniref:Uncharacterized protein LOC110990980 n=1 Tax=Acanthaster planci TaxID=133434 RepID=A0A8B8A492_ACAPL|nr:uncharacterized protein LOC110990980 [Acanthaster planci]